MRLLPELIENNRKWAKSISEHDPEFFSNLAKQQTPEFLWIGCSDSRVPANQIIGVSEFLITLKPIMRPVGCRSIKRTVLGTPVYRIDPTKPRFSVKRTTVAGNNRVLLQYGSIKPQAANS